MTTSCKKTLLQLQDNPQMCSSPCKSKGSTVSKARFTSGVTANAWWLQHRSVSTNCFICGHADKPLCAVGQQPGLTGKEVDEAGALCYVPSQGASQAALQPAQTRL